MSHIFHSFNGICNSNSPQPLWQPPPTALATACRTASGATSEVPSLLMHPCPPPPLVKTGLKINPLDFILFSNYYRFALTPVLFFVRAGNY